MNDKELDAALLRMGFFSIEHCEDEKEHYYYIKASFKWITTENSRIKEDKIQLIGHKDDPNEILNQAKTYINYLYNSKRIIFIESTQNNEGAKRWK